MKRTSGKVKFFNSQKGYGFIISNEENIDVFVHHTSIVNEGGFRSLAEGEEVEFDAIQGPRGIQAINVTGPSGANVIGDDAKLRKFKPNYQSNYPEQEEYDDNEYFLTDSGVTVVQNNYEAGNQNMYHDKNEQYFTNMHMPPMYQAPNGYLMGGDYAQYSTEMYYPSITYYPIPNQQIPSANPEYDQQEI